MAGIAPSPRVRPVASLRDEEIDAFARAIAEVLARQPIDLFCDRIEKLLAAVEAKHQEECVGG